jgi:gluconate 2-dehydrogenase subunit 3-like protein
MDIRGASRRSALKYLGLLAASAAGRQFLAAWLPSPAAHAAGRSDLVRVQGMSHASSEVESNAPYVPQFFTPDEFKTVELLTELILPADDKPGAKEARVGDYIDFVVFSSGDFAPSLQREWSNGLGWLERESKLQFGSAFRRISEADHVKLLTEMSLPERDPKAHHQGYGFFQLVKEMTVEGFYTSRIGLIDVLDYQGMNYLSEFPACTHPEHQR